MTLEETYLEAKREKFPSLCLLIEFLVMEKKVLTFDDKTSDLNLYFKPNNHNKMNALLLEYQTSQSI